jgi:hypothetical protein
MPERNPLHFIITTAGNDVNSICYELHQKAGGYPGRQEIDPTFYPVIYGAAMESDDWTDPEVWKKANPSLGITIGIDKVRAACESAKQNPREENAFRQLRLDQWVKQSIRWMPMDKWDACAFPVTRKTWMGGSATADWTLSPRPISRHSYWCSRRRMRTTNLSSCLTSGCRRTRSTSVSEARPCALRHLAETGIPHDHRGKRGALRIHREIHRRPGREVQHP